MLAFSRGPQAQFEQSLQRVCAGFNDPSDRTQCAGHSSVACFSATGTLMPAAHTLDSLLQYLQTNIRGSGHADHDVRAVSRQMELWYPRPSEWRRYVPDAENRQLPDGAAPPAYTRHLVYGNEHMDVILMHWPAGSRSSIHDHERSSCWVNIVDGSVHEVQYAVRRSTSVPKRLSQLMLSYRRYPAWTENSQRLSCATRLLQPATAGR